MNFEFEALRHARNYRRALLSEFSDFLTGDVIEIGAGIGQFSELLYGRSQIRHLTAVEPDANFCAEFRRRLPSISLVEGSVAALPAEARADAIVTVNVLEHIEEHARELQAYASILAARRGVLCLFVPARQEIYAPLDRDFGHYRRYTKPGLTHDLSRAGFDILRLYYFNFIGYFAWWLNFCLLRSRSFSPASVRLFDRVIFPVAHKLESSLVRPPFGQSLLAVARATRDLFPPEENPSP